MADKRLFLLDGHALVYRAHFAFINRPLINSKGVNTSAVTGFVRTLWDLMRTQKPTHIAVAFDPATPTFRHELMEEYKANREEQPEDIAVALPYIEQILQAFKIPILTVDHYEADDVIGTLAKQAAREGYKVYMVTPDKDFGQLVEENILLYKPSRMGNGVEIMGIQEITDKWGIENCDQVIDILGLMGDSVDNIPGVPGIGPKTAAKLLGKYGSMENLLDHIDELKGKQKANLIEYKDQALLSKKLATIDIEVPIRFNADDYTIDPFDREWLSEIFKELEFRTLAKDILGQKEEQPMEGQQGSLFEQEAVKKEVSSLPKHAIAEYTIENTEHDYHLLGDQAGRAKLLQQLLAASAVAFDTETTGIDANNAELVGMSFSVEPKVAYYIPVPADREVAQQIVDEFRPFFEHEGIAKIGQNLKYDALILKWYGVDLVGDYLDTMVIHYLLEPEQRHNMDYLAETYLSYKPVSIETLIGKGKKQKSMRDVPVDQVVDYAAEDADITLRLQQLLEPELEKRELHELYKKTEAPLIRVLRDMEYQGINVDTDFLHDYSKTLDQQIRELEESVYEQAGTEFNLGSPKQVGEILFDKLEIPYRFRKTKSGQYSTDEAKLTELSTDYPIVKGILKHRGLTKLKGTYVDALPKLVNPRTHRIHSSFNQAIAATGRLSSNNPNLQNIPVRTPEGAEIRKAFIPRDEDHVLLAADYSQIELRLVAALSKDEGMLEAFRSGRDIHRATASLVFDVPYDEVSREQRYQAKTVNFAILYGAGAQRLTQELDISRSEAKTLIENYYTRFSGLKNFFDESIRKAREQGYVTTLLGRKRKVRDINSKSSVARSLAERIAMNTPIQGTAADMIKVAMIDIHQLLAEGNYKTTMILQVHDELVFDAHRAELEELTPKIEEKMRLAIPDLGVPIVVESGTGENWLEAH